MYITKEDGTQELNKSFRLIRGQYLIRCEKGNEVIYFIVTAPQKSFSDDGVKQLEVTCYELHYEWKDKIVRLLEGTFQFYDPVGNNGVLNRTLLRMTDWTVDYIDSELFTKWRTFDVSEQDLLSFVFDSIEAYGTFIPIIDTVNKRISVYKVENYGRDNGLAMEYGGYLKSLSETENFDEVVTRLYIYGNENLSINALNPTGSDYLENFQFYRNGYTEDELGNVISHSPYMSDNLCKALNAYDELLESKRNEFAVLLDNKANLQRDKTDRENELFDLQTELAQLLDNKDTLIGTGGDLTSINSQITAKETQISNKQDEIDAIDSDIDQIDSQITSLRNEVSKENNFTADEIKELNYFIKEKTWQDNHYDSSEDLYEQGDEYLSLWSLPQLVYEIDSVDFINALNVKYDRDKLRLGEVVTIYFPEFNIDLKVKIISYDLDIDDHALQLTIANTDDIHSPFFNQIDLLKRSASTSTSVDMSKFKWDLSEDNHTEVQNILNNKWDSNKNAIVGGTNLQYELNERGLTIRDPNDPSRFLRAVNSTLSITNDGGNSWKNAIRADGITGELIIGQIIASTNLTVTNTSGSFVLDQNGATLTDMDLIITRTGNRSRILMNATDGLKIQSSTNGTTWVDRLYADTNGNLNFTGALNGATGTFTGALQGGSIDIGSGNNRFKADTSGVYIGHNTFGSAPFRVTYSGNATLNNLTANSATINNSDFNNGSIVGSTLTIGSGNNSLRFNPSNGLWAGHSSYGSAPFRVSLGGAVVASNLTINGGSINWGNVGAPTAAQTGALPSNSPMLTHITSTGVYTGTLTANQVNAVAINASSITTGTMDAERILGGDLTISNNITLAGSSTDKTLNFGGNYGLITFSNNGNLSISNNGYVNFVGQPQGVMIDFVRVATQSDISSLQNHIDALYNLIGNKSNIGHTHRVTTANHNHGNPNNANSGGGTYTTTGSTN